jgi:SAGA-associated factor 73
MKIFGSRPLTATSEIGLVKCKECSKPVLKSFMADHAGMFFSLLVILADHNHPLL